jgi:hypothetical protein
MMLKNKQQSGDPSQPINLDFHQREKLKELIEILRKEANRDKKGKKERVKNGANMSVVERLHI